MSDLSFVGLSLDELEARCITDGRARQYVADHADEILRNVVDQMIDFDQEDSLRAEIRWDLILEMRNEFDDDDQLLDAIESCQDIAADPRHKEAAQKIEALLAQIHAFLNADD